ncbi:heparinase II/III domain-containing protein [Cellulomonas sp. FA1]|uniref:heparinase II/III domain-containing protein n=1 Tax=Cellulomonas sp. FA1 TaxID=1346710 RepID=UPI0006256D3B|nr:heparinase II/III family protein [Cellulomonas sp. FA1]
MTHEVVGNPRGQLFHTYTTISRHDPSPAALATMVLDGRLRLFPHAEVDLEQPFTWSEDPLDDANWRFQFHSLVWLDRVREAGAELDEPVVLAWYEATLRSWIDANAPGAAASEYAWFDMAVGLRAVVLAFAVDHFGPQDWLLRALEVHGAHLADPQHYDERGNHGLHQDLGLLVAAQLLGRDAWVRLARDRIVRMFEAAIDEQGVCREGCVDYQYRNYRWYHEALRRLTAAGVTDVTDLEDRLSRMPEFLAHATAPSGDYALLGDTLQHSAARIEGTAADWVRERTQAPADRVRVYDAGYVFARRRWTTFAEDRENAYLTQRFGPGRATAVHGHEDAGSITLDAFGETLLRDSGLYAYEAGDERLYFRGRASHNVIDVPGRKYYPSAHADLVALDTDDGRVFTTVKVVALQGVVWHRTSLWLPEERVLLVDDRVRVHGDDTVLQRWQLPEHARAEVGSDGSEVIVTTQAGNVVRMCQYSAPDRVVIASGGRQPLDGWVSRSYREMTPAPALTFAQHGESVRFTTLISYADIADRLTTVRLHRRSAKDLRLTVGHGTDAAGLLVSSDGYAATRDPGVDL